SPDIKECFFLDNDAPVSTLDDLSIAVATDGRACEISGMLTGEGVKPGITVQALSTTGEDTATVIFTVTPIPLGLVRQVSSGGDYTCAISVDDEIFCWGDTGAPIDPNEPRDTLIIRTPTKFTTPVTDWTQVSGGSSHTCAINTAGALYCWGNGNTGRLGLNDTDSRDTPTKVGDATNWTQVSAGSSHTCAVNTAGELYCWGGGFAGRLGLNDANDRRIPTKVTTPVTNWTQVNAGDGHTCAINTTGELYCWGRGFAGRLGLNDANNRMTPTKVGNATNWTQVNATVEHTCAINTAGELYCWGLGRDGRLGLNDTDNRTIPTKVGNATNWTQVSAGTDHTCTINTTGELYCWGLGRDGNLGLGDTDNHTIPTKVGNATNWTQVTVASSHTCAINTTGQLYCWGDSSSGYLGLGTITGATTTPQLVNTPRTPTAAPVLANIMLTGPAGVFGAGNTIPPLTFANTGGD
ncbi:MAG: hypothetical protein K8963_01230, partial [Proteobacteria bacterium]|nr:hypothetical protein [Pseudomonadota bacterium]